MSTTLERVLSSLVLGLGLASGMAHAQIVSAGGGGTIKFRSGYAPFDRPYGYMTTPLNVSGFTPMPLPGGLALQRWHLSPDGYAEGGTAVNVVVPAPSTRSAE